MALTLTIENQASLPDGGPLSVTLSGGRGLDIGRDQHLDWCLPDPSRAISGRHCEIRFSDNAYWLRDISTNGTFVNGGAYRVQSPYRLQHGDRLEIGHYIIAVSIDEAERNAVAGAERPPMPPPPGESLWDSNGDEAPPIARRDLMPPQKYQPVHAPFIDWAADIPAPSEEPPAYSPGPVPPSRPDELAWAPYQAPPAPEPEPIAPIPTPRRPASSAGQGDPWNEGPAEILARPSFDAPYEPPPRPAAPPPATPAGLPPAGPSISPAEFIARFARGAGLPVEELSWQDPGAFAEQTGALMRLIATELKALLAARAESKRIARSSNQTMIQAQDNNPLKFSPTIEDALKLIFGRPTSGYLNAQKAFEESFRDLKIHQIKTYSAMQHALRMLVEDLDPQAVSESLDAGRGLEGLLSSRKGKLWDAYVARWEAKTAPYEDGLVDAFMLYFAECYDRGGR
ncbi:type VI secretion system-associated FHA domain protein TagH [Bosea sp. CS1GBMeth4]|uniref:type VI secretion system-associated FHA domain protein TagH n=1 Tax=Bosea sp. CS1GBMeth4 TaxID=1892849 RepID=UPI0016481534|nr:type VI secretion system-associated FHA domain protein TagH [Bosea sp. CS1GBMeth4]